MTMSVPMYISSILLVSGNVMFSSAIQPLPLPPRRRPPHHNFVVSVITFEGFKFFKLDTCINHPNIADQGSVVQRHRKVAIQYRHYWIHENLSQLIFAVVQRGCNICGARNHNANPLKLATGLDLLQTLRSEQWSHKLCCKIL